MRGNSPNWAGPDSVDLGELVFVGLERSGAEYDLNPREWIVVVWLMFFFF